MSPFHRSEIECVTAKISINLYGNSAKTIPVRTLEGNYKKCWSFQCGGIGEKLYSKATDKHNFSHSSSLTA